jgi:hypothetical protein
MHPEWIAAIAGGAAALISLLTWRTTVNALHATYRPVLRPVPLRDKNGGPISSMSFLAKNIGLGPAIGILVFDKANLIAPIAKVDVIESLGQALTAEGGEHSRVGRGVVKCNPFLIADHEYRLLYQDYAGVWHETVFTMRQTRFDTVRYLGPSRQWDPGRTIPYAAQEEGLVTTTFDPSSNY